MVKFLLGIAIVAFTSFCGRLLAKKYRQRKLFFKQMQEFNERFLSEISYYRRPVREFISSYAYKGEFQQLLRDYFFAIDEKLGVLSLAEETQYSFLKEEEKRTVENYFLMLGKGDSSSQKGYFTSLKGRLSVLQEETEKEEKKYGDLYVKLGFLCGLLILILII